MLIYALLFWQGLRLWRGASESAQEGRSSLSPLPLREGDRGRGSAAASSTAPASSRSGTHHPLPLSPSLEGRGDQKRLRLGATVLLALIALTMLVSAPILIVGGIIMAVRTDVVLSGLLIVVLPLMALVIGLVMSRAIPLFQANQAKIDRINQVMRETLATL